jgi:hypothetical protein
LFHLLHSPPISFSSRASDPQPGPERLLSHLCQLRRLLLELQHPPCPIIRSSASTELHGVPPTYPPFDANTTSHAYTPPHAQLERKDAAARGRGRGWRWYNAGVYCARSASEGENHAGREGLSGLEHRKFFYGVSSFFHLHGISYAPNQKLTSLFSSSL